MICAIGMGVAGLFPAFSREDGSVWHFRHYTLTAISVFELARNPDFANLPVIPEGIYRSSIYRC